MPILNLPTLPPPSPSQPNRQARPMAPLRSLPALLMQGPSGSDQDVDHENTSLEDEDEEDEDEITEEAGQGAGSDDSGDEDEELPPREPMSVAGPSRLPLLPDVGITGFSVSFESAGVHSSTPGVHPQARPSVDYFTSKPPDPSFSPMRTPRGSDFRPNGKARATEPVPQPRILPMPATPGSPRPGLYHQVSKSMIDLTSIMRKDKIVSPKLGRTPSKKSKPQGLAITVENLEPPPTTEPPDDVITSPMLRRRRSLPVYEPSSDPPPYPDPVFRWKGLPAYQSREDEGRETLPPYSNSIYLTGAMPRKMEFSQHGVQAKDRKWRRVYCVLEGTALRVYKCPPAASGVSVIEQWWENTMGVGDITSVNVTAVTSTGTRVSAIREREGEPENARIPKIVEESASGQESTPRPDANEQPRSRPPSLAPPSTKSVLGLTSRFLRRQRSKSAIRSSINSEAPTSRLSMDSRQENTRNPSATAARHSMDTLGSSRPCNASSSISNTTSSTSLTVPSPPNSASSTTSNDSPSRFSRSRLLSHSHSHSHSSAGTEKKDKEKDKDTPYKPDPKDLIRQYSLQHAESGLASDYQKRKNVIRVRVEGEQFLLQAKDVAAVIDWIEGIQMGTNIALDLDERSMPRGPIFPRRRRRRPRRVDANGTSQPSGA
ncbi:hypothetical protein C8Q74DRAFT_1208137 [Fomes fomentarius]|nr:hypothetical protein C8Q74DRAFT_1208137 [Fomes fomentarius]